MLPRQLYGKYENNPKDLVRSEEINMNSADKIDKTVITGDDILPLNRQDKDPISETHLDFEKGKSEKR